MGAEVNRARGAWKKLNGGRHQRFMFYLSLFAFLLWSATGLLGQSSPLTFAVVPVQGTKPSARIDPPLAYDPVGRRVFMFGGQDDSSNRNDLWAYSIDSQSWSQLNPQGVIPPARLGHTMVFDSAARRLIVFGGQASGFFSDTWAYDIGKGTWAQLSRNGEGPSNRYGHSAIYETARGRMVISHGFTDQGRFDDTWAFDLKLEKWQNISPPGDRPLKRCLHHAVYDEKNGHMLLYGGCSSGSGPCPQDDLWSFDFGRGRWSEITKNPRPTGRQWYGTSFDIARGRMVVFGGTTVSDLWEFDTAASAWSRPTFIGDVPEGRSRHEGVFVPDLNATLFFGGRTSRGITNELLALSSPLPPRVVAGSIGNAFSADRSSVAPGEIVSVFGVGLGPATGVSARFDPATRKLPTALGGASVTLNGIPAPLYFAGAGQINLQVPYELAGQSFADVVVTFNGVASAAPERVRLAVTHPGLYPGVFNQDGSVNSAANPAAPGSVIVLFATGQGLTRPASQTGRAAEGTYPEPEASVALRIADRSAELLFSGQAPDTAGVMQINARLPSGLASGAALPIVLTMGAASSQTGVTVAVR